MIKKRKAGGRKAPGRRRTQRHPEGKKFVVEDFEKRLAKL
jgi:hypothetical protein